VKRRQRADGRQPGRSFQPEFVKDHQRAIEIGIGVAAFDQRYGAHPKSQPIGDGQLRAFAATSLLAQNVADPYFRSIADGAAFGMFARQTTDAFTARLRPKGADGGARL
jgi:hypothetical protein